MKGLTIEEKAKAYDEAYARISKAYNDNRCSISFINEIFPRFTESKDERIRKELIKGISKTRPNTPFLDTTVTREEILSWLEKQGEHADFLSKIQVGDRVTRNEGGVLVNISQLERVAKPRRAKPADKIESKFKVGDIITNGIIIGKVDENENNKYHGWFGYDKDLSVHYADIPDVENWHLWTIQDAKDGDVLATDDGNIFVFYGTVEDDKYPFAYYGLTRRRFESYDRRLPFTHNNIHPATKEQRDQLEKAMADAGYTFDFEKKELRKIEQKLAWSEEDGKKAERIIRLLQEAYDINCINGSIDWLKFLKYRVQPKQEWSEEDNLQLQAAIDICKSSGHTITSDWLKSLKERVQPQTNITDEELAQAKKDAYNDALDKIEDHSDWPTFDDGWSAAIRYLKKRNTY